MSALQEVHQLLNAQTIAMTSGDVSVTTNVLDLRGGPQTRILQINSMLLRSVATAGAPNIRLRWAGGVTSNQVGTTPNLGNLFQPFDANDDLIANSEGSEELLIVPMPFVYAPFVRFQVTVLNGAPATASVSLWALCQVARA